MAETYAAFRKTALVDTFWRKQGADVRAWMSPLAGPEKLVVDACLTGSAAFGPADVGSGAARSPVAYFSLAATAFESACSEAWAAALPANRALLPRCTAAFSTQIFGARVAAARLRADSAWAANATGAERDRTAT